MSEENKNIINTPLNEGHYTEAVDRAYIVANFIETTLIEHPVIDKHPELKEKVEKAQELILEIYQEIGSMSIRLFVDPSELPDWVKDDKE